MLQNAYIICLLYCVPLFVQNGGTECVQILIKQADSETLVNQQDSAGITAVHIAAGMGHCSIIRCLASVPTCDLDPEDKGERSVFILSKYPCHSVV